MGIWYTTREDVMSAQDTRASAYTTARVDSAIESASRAAEEFLHRKFYPWLGVRYFDYPDQWGRSAPAWRIWLGQYDLISLTSITNGDGTSVPVGNVFLDPQDGPPYERVDVSLATSSAFSSGSTFQRALAISGKWGYSDNLLTGPLLSTSPSSASATIGVAASGVLGVGSLLLVDSERLNVTDRTWLATSDTSISLAAQNNVTAVTVSSGATYAAGERLMIDSEELLIGAVTGNVLTVRRAQNGTVLAAHTNAALYAPRTLSVDRAQLGTTAASHTAGAAVYLWKPPSVVTELTRAYALTSLQGTSTGYQTSSGGQDNNNTTSYSGVADIERRAMVAVGRQLRQAAI